MGNDVPNTTGKNFTYILQMKDQIGSFYYFPSLAFHKAAAAMSYLFLMGILINGRGLNGAFFTVEQGKTYRLRISNIGLESSLNFQIDGHNMTLVEVEGTHTMQTTYSFLDIHVGQSYSVLITADQAPKDYYIVVSSRFSSKVLTTTGVLHYSNSNSPVPGPPPGCPTIENDWSLNQARSIRTNLSTNGPRPNLQGVYHYGMINITRTIRLANSAGQVNGKQRYAVNNWRIQCEDIADAPTGGGIYLGTSVLGTDYRTYIEIVLENRERIIQSWHLDGYAFWVVGMDEGEWSPASRGQYNLRDAVSRCTTQVYPMSWTAIYVALDNVGMWNLRSEFWARHYLGQQLYMRVYATSTSLRDEYPVPKNALLCGKAK
ncbi:L-ascorbate oxidase homolog [Nicotiana tabacum]|uniref:L-ascorbate oxidase homolog n=1 Tax=Nicotiana tabacum TaxID=4097 RepID=A0AC58TGL0_TOBAC